MADSLAGLLNWKYIGVVFLAGLVIRMIVTFFKAHAILQGEADYDGYIYPDKQCWCKAFGDTFVGFFHHRNIDDYWLSTLIGMAEMYFYPVFITQGRWDIIGGWLAVKTATAWRTWQMSRTPYSRFLFGNILAICASIVMIKIFNLH